MIREWNNAELMHARPFDHSRVWNSEERLDGHALPLGSIQERNNAELMHAFPFNHGRVWNNEERFDSHAFPLRSRHWNQRNGETAVGFPP